MEYTRTLTPPLSHPMGEGRGEGRHVVYLANFAVTVPATTAGFIKARNGRRFLLPLVLLLLLASTCLDHAYSLLTHEQIVDIAWKDHIKPLLRERFPNASPEELRSAHASAYGGCLIQDLGFYPFGNPFFSGLTHYVRSGDFVGNLLREASNVQEYAFALGALAHYCGDTAGHPLVNRAVAMDFPELRKRHGDEVTYEDDRIAHLRVEFGFDVAQVAKGRYTAQNYRDFIGFKVEQPLLERAFFKTYDLQLSDVIGHEDLAIGSFRRASGELLPELTRAALVSRREQLLREIPDFSEKKFLYNLSRAEYEKQWGTEYRRPSLLARCLTLLVRLLPKIGPLKVLDPEVPTPETEQLYFASVNRTVELYQAWLGRIAQGADLLPDNNLDTGRPAVKDCYALSDQTYGRLLEQLSGPKINAVSPTLRENILGYFTAGRYADSCPVPKLSCKALDALRALQVMETASDRLNPKKPGQNPVRAQLD